MLPLITVAGLPGSVICSHMSLPDALITTAIQMPWPSRDIKVIHITYMNRERLKKLATDSANETLGRTSIPTVSCSAKVSISVGHAFFDMYDFKPVYRPRAYPGRITKNWMREEATPCSTSGNRSRTCFWALWKSISQRQRGGAIAQTL